MHLAYPAHIPNPFALLDDESFKTHATAAHTVSAETEIDKDEPTPPSSLAALVSPASKFVKGIAPPPATHLHIVKPVKESKSGGQPFQCVKCHGTLKRVRNFDV